MSGRGPGQLLRLRITVSVSLSPGRVRVDVASDGITGPALPEPEPESRAA